MQVLRLKSPLNKQCNELKKNFEGTVCDISEYQGQEQDLKVCGE